MKNLLSTRDVAQILQVSPRQVARLVVRGVIEPALQAPGPRGAFLFDVDAVRLFEDAQ